VTVDIISRARWGARYSAGFGPSPLPARELWLHHSVTIAPDLVWVDADGDGVEDDEERAMRTLEDIGQQRFGGGISYTFAVMPSGRIYEGHGIGRQGAHTGGRNDIARAIVLVGDYSNREPTEAQQNAVAWLVELGRQQGWWTVTGLSGGHRQAPGQIATACPGDAALRRIPAINQRVVDYRAGRIDLEDDDMTPDELLDTEVEVRDANGKVTKKASLRQIFEWQDNNFAEVMRRVDALTERVEQVSKRQEESVIGAIYSGGPDTPDGQSILEILKEIRMNVANPPHSL
jgi:hypothetical protein